VKIEVNQTCFVCGSMKSKLFFEIDYSSLHYPGKFAIRKCDRCGLLFNSPRLVDEELFKLYNANYYFFQRHDSDEFKRVVALFLRTAALIPNGIFEKKVIEVGCGKGYLLALMKHLGWKVQGIEISSEASQFAISRFGVPTFTGTLESYSKNEQHNIFPVVMALDVIEHVPDPVEFLKSIDKILCNDGILIIDTPNGNSKNIDNLGKKWEAFNPFHIYFFSPSILQTLLSEMDYSIEKCFSYNNHKKMFNLKHDLHALLLQLRIHELAEYLYKKILSITKEPEKDIESLINNAIKIIQNSNTYFGTNDSKDTLAKDDRGDNIVIIARKNSLIRSRTIN